MKMPSTKQVNKPLDIASNTDVNSTLASRQSSHGDFIQNSIVMQSLKDICRNSPNWNNLPPHMKEAIDMNCHKLGRILSGDPNFVDHWHDIGGYVKLVENILTIGKSHP